MDRTTRRLAPLLAVALALAGAGCSRDASSDTAPHSSSGLAVYMRRSGS